MAKIFVLLCLIALSLGKVTVQVEPKNQDCFLVDSNAGQRIKIPFFVTRGGLLDIDLRVYDPAANEIYRGLHFESSVYEFIAAQSGSYSICWNNEMARWTAKVVQFDILVGDEINKKQTGIPDYSSSNTLTPMEESIKYIAQSLDHIEADQKYLRVREQKHRDTAESTNTRVLWYSIVESVMLIGISLGQVYALRRFFEVKRPV